MQIRLLVFCCFITTLLLLGACSSNRVSSTLEEYIERLARVVEKAPPTIVISAMPAFPTKAEMRQAVQPFSLNVREFLNLPNCHLSTLIAERNTAMGKTQLPSQRFVYEVNVTQALKECAESTADTALQDQLNQLALAKQAQLSVGYANLIQTSEELLLALSQAQGFIAGDGSDGLHQTVAALQYLIAVNPNQPHHLVKSKQLEEHLQALLKYRLPAKMWRTQTAITAHLQAANAWLSPALAEVDCERLAGQQKAAVLGNVFRLFFAEKIQPLAAQLNTYHYKLTPVLTKLLSEPNLSPKLRDRVQQRISAHETYSQAIREHVVLWQDLFSRCEISVAVL